MSEKIVQVNEEVIKGQLKELVRGRSTHGDVSDRCVDAPRRRYHRSAIGSRSFLDFG